MEEKKVEQYAVPKLKLEIKQNAKKEKYYCYTIRADNVTDLEKLNEEVKALAQKQV